MEHLHRCRDNHVSMIRQHMAFTGTAVISPGDFLVHARQWTGLPTVKLLGLMRGASTISGGSSTQHAAMVAAYRADDAARKELDSDEDPGALLERLRREPSATGQALNDYLDLVGYRLLDGFDISNHCALELPDVLLRSIRTAIDEADRDVGPRSAGGRGSQSRSRGASRGVRRPARGGPCRLLGARRARCLRRHLGVRADAACRAGSGPSTRGAWASPRCRALRLRGHRRDVRVARGSVGADGRGAGGPPRVPPDVHREGRPGASGRRAPADA